MVANAALVIRFAATKITCGNCGWIDGLLQMSPTCVNKNGLCAALPDRCRGARSQARAGSRRMTFPCECVNVRGMGVSSRFNSNSVFPARVASAASQLLQPQTAAACTDGGQHG